MEILYKKKNYTQGHLRKMIKDKKEQGKTYRDIKKELGYKTPAEVFYGKTIKYIN